MDYRDKPPVKWHPPAPIKKVPGQESADAAFNTNVPKHNRSASKRRALFFLGIVVMCVWWFYPFAMRYIPAVEQVDASTSFWLLSVFAACALIVSVWGALRIDK